MGHADYAVLHRYVRLSSERDLRPLSERANDLVIDGANWPAAGRAGGGWK